MPGPLGEEPGPTAREIVARIMGSGLPGNIKMYFSRGGTPIAATGDAGFLILFPRVGPSSLCATEFSAGKMPAWADDEIIYDVIDEGGLYGWDTRINDPDLISSLSNFFYLESYGQLRIFGTVNGPKDCPFHDSLIRVTGQPHWRPAPCNWDSLAFKALFWDPVQESPYDGDMYCYDRDFLGGLLPRDWVWDFYAARDAIALIDPYLDFRELDRNGDGMVDYAIIIRPAPPWPTYGIMYFDYYPFDIMTEDSVVVRLGGAFPLRDTARFSGYWDCVYPELPDTLKYDSKEHKAELLHGIAHELAHNLGIPDKYDLNDWFYNPAFGSSGTGIYSFIKVFAPGPPSRKYMRSFSPLDKARLGWKAPQELTESGHYAVRPFSTENPQGPAGVDVYKITVPFPYYSPYNPENYDYAPDTQQYFLLAYHGKTSHWEDVYEAEGLIIYHINDLTPPFYYQIENPPRITAYYGDHFEKRKNEDPELASGLWAENGFGTSPDPVFGSDRHDFWVNFYYQCNPDCFPEESWCLWDYVSEKSGRTWPQPAYNNPDDLFGPGINQNFTHLTNPSTDAYACYEVDYHLRDHEQNGIYLRPGKDAWCFEASSFECYEECGAPDYKPFLRPAYHCQGQPGDPEYGEYGYPQFIASHIAVKNISYEAGAMGFDLLLDYVQSDAPDATGANNAPRLLWDSNFMHMAYASRGYIYYTRREGRWIPAYPVGLGTRPCLTQAENGRMGVIWCSDLGLMFRKGNDYWWGDPEIILRGAGLSQAGAALTGDTLVVAVEKKEWDSWKLLWSAFSFSEPGTPAWREIARADVAPPEMSGPSVGVWEDTAFIAYSNPEDGDVYLARVSLGQARTKPLIINLSESPGVPSVHPSMAMATRTPFVVWSEGGEIFLEGDTWDNLNISSSPGVPSDNPVIHEIPGPYLLSVIWQEGNGLAGCVFDPDEGVISRFSRPYRGLWPQQTAVKDSLYFVSTVWRDRYPRGANADSVDEYQVFLDREKIPGSAVLEPRLPDRIFPEFNLWPPISEGNRLSVRFSLPEQRRASLVIYDASGRRRELILDRTIGPGTYETFWEGVLPSGVYFLMLTQGKRSRVRKFVRM